jgi:hypothetical protein
MAKTSKARAIRSMKVPGRAEFMNVLSREIRNWLTASIAGRGGSLDLGFGVRCQVFAGVRYEVWDL